jgi:hypothetical protein
MGAMIGSRRMCIQREEVGKRGKIAEQKAIIQR